MAILVHETFGKDWEKSWDGKIHNSYVSEDSLQLMFKRNEHYGCALHRDVTPSRHVKMSYRLKILPSWNSDSTGKTLGFADLRWKDSRGRSFGHGNRRPSPDGFSFRTWFGKTSGLMVPVGMYVYHLGQKPRWGDSVKVGSVKVGGPEVLFECEADFDEGFIRARVDGKDWVRHNIVVSDKTAVTRAWLDAYYGGPAVPNKNMAWTVRDYKLENWGVDPKVDEVDWDAIAKLVAAKEEADKQTEEAEKAVEKPVSIADQLRLLADKVEMLEG